MISRLPSFPSVRPVLLALVAVVASLPLTPLGASAQQSTAWEGVRFEIDRSRLTEVKAELESTLSSGVLRQKEQVDVRFQLEVVTDRLQNGDLREGDRIVLNVRGEAELTDTFTVLAGPMVRLPEVGEVPVGGILASELEPHLRAALSTVLQSPEVSARAMLQLTVSGAVLRPGFYFVTADALVSDVIMMAGGPTTLAKLDDVSIERGPWRPDAPEQSLADASLQSLSVNRLGLRGGDRIVVPGSSGISTRDFIQWGFLGIAAIASIASIVGG